jgi:magnesium transporter
VQILSALELEAAAHLLRRLEAGAQEGLLGRMEARRARNLRLLLGFAPNSAGALMDPDVLALAQDLSAREALVRVREAAEQARYNLYVVDRSQKLVGVLNLRELLLARGRAPLTDLMVRDPQRIRASADRMAVVGHPGWREVHALPVVDDQDVYLGAIRYRTLRELEAALNPERSMDTDASTALGQLFAAGAGGLLDALSVGGRDGS